MPKIIEVCAGVWLTASAVLGCFMRIQTAFISILASTVLSATSAHAKDSRDTESSDANVFKADMSNPDLAAAITTFQEVCLPFIMHTSEVEPKVNREHHLKLLAQQGFAHQSLDTRGYRAFIEPKLGEWKRASRVATTPRHLTVFNGVSNQVVPATELPVRRAGEIMRTYVRTPLKTVSVSTDTFINEAHPRQTIALGWRHPYKTYQAELCKITLEKPAISSESFKADFINKDADWLETYLNGGSWIQCTMGGADAVQFAVEHSSVALSISVLREALLEPKLCGEVKKAAP